MLIRASDFSTLPEGCPARAGILSGHVGAVATEDRYWFHWPGSREPIEVLPEDMQVDITTPAAVRAFAPALICAVKGLQNAPEQPPVPVYFSQHFYFVLVEYVYGNDVVCWKPSESDIIADTPEACLLAGLQAALDAAKGAE